jgi:hypothetical protein
VQAVDKQLDFVRLPRSLRSGTSGIVRFYVAGIAGALSGTRESGSTEDAMDYWLVVIMERRGGLLDLEMRR